MAHLLLPAIFSFPMWLFFLLLYASSYPFLTSPSGNTNHFVSFQTLKWIGQKQKEGEKEKVFWVVPLYLFLCLNKLNGRPKNYCLARFYIYIYSVFCNICMLAGGSSGGDECNHFRCLTGCWDLPSL